MNKEKPIQVLCAQLLLVVVLISYLLNIFHNNLFTISHKLSHQITSIFEYPDADHHHLHNSSNSEQVNKSHAHNHHRIHEHKTLSFLKTIFKDYDTKKTNPKSKEKNNIDKHITNNTDITTSISLLFTTHNYEFTDDFTPLVKLIIWGPPPKFIVT